MKTCGWKLWTGWILLACTAILYCGSSTSFLFSSLENQEALLDGFFSYLREMFYLLRQFSITGVQCCSSAQRELLLYLSTLRAPRAAPSDLNVFTTVHRSLSLEVPLDAKRTTTTRTKLNESQCDMNVPWLLIFLLLGWLLLTSTGSSGSMYCGSP